ncbi:tetratricopeptide repeat protein [Streptomyces sp. NPDC002133]|uniref:tetratricopeptide repeat protein n=1 Tax=Streptomyces sp. NPDC002133 TaxID=3154409 RepID=UPI0033292815
MSDNRLRRERRADQRAEAADAAQVTQVAGDQYIHVHAAAGPAPLATAALPAAPTQLVGRDDEASRLLRLLDPAIGGPNTKPAVVVSAVSGLAGIGKTALALQVAHEAAVVHGWFPGGVMFVNLRGYDPGGKVTPEQALGALLRALGVRDEEMPPTPDEQAAVFRSKLARLADEGRHVLLVADNASSAAQVEPLVPARREHRLLVTSRDTLATLPARQLGLGELTPASAGALITAALSRARPDDPRPHREQPALAEVVAYCGGLPLALEIAAARLTGDPGLPIADLAADLADSRTRLKALHYDDGGQPLAVRAAFGLSYRRLSPEMAALFRLLSLNPGPELSTDAASALVGRPAREGLAALARAALVSEHPVGAGRWRMHDLIRLYAAELAAEDDAEHQARAVDRLLRYYHTTLTAASSFLWGRSQDDTSGPFASRKEAVAWLQTERPNLTAAARSAAAGHRDAVGHLDIAVSMAFSLGVFLFRWRYHDDDIAVLTDVVRAAEQTGTHPRAVAGLRNGLGLSLSSAGQASAGLRELRKSVESYRTLAGTDPTVEPSLGRALANLAYYDDSPRDRRAAAEEAVAIGRRWSAGGDSADDVVELAGALDNLSRALADLGLYAEALEPAREAVEIRRRQVALAPGGFEHFLAEVLISLGDRLLATGRYEEAMASAEEGVATYSRLASESPAAHEPLLPGALGTLGLAYALAGQLDAARDTYARAMAVVERLGDRYQEAPSLRAFAAHLARTERRPRKRGRWGWSRRF